MSTENLVITAVLLVILGEVTYLIARLPRQTNSKKRMVFVDTSVLIDGRIIAVAQSGFMNDTLVVPRSVVGELQFLADNADHDKRSRARYGLDVVKELQEMAGIDVLIMQDSTKANEGVDNRLLQLAKKYHGAICTIDYNLNKVAVVEGITVLNVNELAQSLRMAYLPGEKILLELVQKGQDSHQAVGYLADGTMVVVEHAYKQIGKTVEVEFIRSLQTAAGKMMFAKRVERSQDQPAQAKVSKGLSTETSIANGAPAVRGKKRINGRTPTNTTSAAPSQKESSSKSGRQSRPRQNDREATLIDLVERQ